MKPLIPQEMRARTISNIIVIAFAAFMAAILYYFGNIAGFFRSLLDAALPFLIGFAIAFLLLPIVKKVEWFLGRTIFKRKPHPRISRVLATSAAIILLLAIITGFVAILVPQLYNSIKSLLLIISRLIAQYTPMIERFLLNLKFLNIEGEQLVVAWENVTSQLMNILNYSSTLMNGLWGVTNGIYSTVFQLFVGLIAAFYLLMDKERSSAQAKKICYAIWKKSTCETLIYWTRRAHTIFAGFITGKILDSLIIGVICYFFMLIARLEYPLLISVIVGVTNIIPFFGPFIGAIPCALLLLLDNPMHALMFLIFVIILQQLDGNVIGPKILGDSTGLSALWVMFGILLFGGLWGILGMLIGVPLMAVIYDIIRQLTFKGMRERGYGKQVDAYNQKYHPAGKAKGRKQVPGD